MVKNFVKISFRPLDVKILNTSQIVVLLANVVNFIEVGRFFFQFIFR